MEAHRAWRAMNFTAVTPALEGIALEYHSGRLLAVLWAHPAFLNPFSIAPNTITIATFSSQCYVRNILYMELFGKLAPIFWQ